MRAALDGKQGCNYRVEMSTGGRHQVMESLTRAVAAYIRSDGPRSSVTRVYIGIASGPDAVSAMKRRYDDYKFDEGINEMVAIYESTSQDFARAVEADLEKIFREQLVNRTGGGGGRDSQGPNFYVYLAMRKWG